jgi:hypothetical protein
VVLDAHLRKPHQGRGLPPAQQRPPTLIGRTVTAGPAAEVAATTRDDAAVAATR